MGLTVTSHSIKSINKTEKVTKKYNCQLPEEGKNSNQLEKFYEVNVFNVTVE